ncbi:MAG: alcohol dehydrogenase catalytic domain-containing protein [Acidobacteriota bacterium]|nr:alcohol dehydrogenase catalytic domain-containing protein [Acidobacteriota bacterium]
MLVAELAGLREFHLVERELPDPGPGEVQVRVAAIGICGSDMHSYAEGAVGDTPCSYPMVLGHEPSGTVVKTGAGVSGLLRGNLAALEPALYCYHCEFCLSGHHNVCANLRFLSSPQDPGFFREFVNLPARNLIPLPPGIGLAEATLIEPLAVVLHSLGFLASERVDTAAVFGAGPIGLLTAAALKLAGASRVWAIDPVAHRLEMAKAIGADAVIDPGAPGAPFEADPVRQIMADTGNRGVDVALDCAAKDDSLNQCVGVLRHGGRLVLTGIPAYLRANLDIHSMRRKEITLFSVRRSNHESEIARDMLREHGARFAGVITHRRPLDRIGEAFTMVEHYSDGAGKVLIEPA